MPGIKARIAALTEVVRFWKEQRDTPHEDLDPLSQALVDYVAELRALDTPEKKAAYCEKSGITLAQLTDHIRAMTVDY